ncbi:MAG: hypothetical protein ACKVOB_11895 [Sphingomonas sp.]
MVGIIRRAGYRNNQHRQGSKDKNQRDIAWIDAFRRNEAAASGWPNDPERGSPRSFQSHCGDTLLQEDRIFAFDISFASTED